MKKQNVERKRKKERNPYEKCVVIGAALSFVSALFSFYFSPHFSRPT